MKSGVPGFRGPYLTEAIECRGLSSASLADLLGISRSAVSHYETGLHTPSPEVFEKICKTLNLPPSFFTRPSFPVSQEVVFFRSMNPAMKVPQRKALRRLEWLQAITGYVRAYVELHDLDFPKFSSFKDPIEISDSEIESCALRLRAAWGIGSGPVGNLVRILENNGFIVAYDDFDSTMDGVSCFDDEGIPFIIVSRSSWAAQAREDLAYALGHLILHRYVEKSRFGINRDFAILRRQAFRFAAAFLMPEESFCLDVYAHTLDALRLQKAKWKVPIGLMVRRLQDLDLIDAEQAKKLWINRSRRGWRTEEPLDHDIPKEECRLLAESIKLMVDESAQSKSELLYALPLSDRDIETLTGLPTGYISDSMPVVSIIPPEKRTAPSRSNSGDKGQLISFPTRNAPTKEKRRKIN